jgi:hypothetical protein
MPSGKILVDFAKPVGGNADGGGSASSKEEAA